MGRSRRWRAWLAGIPLVCGYLFGQQKSGALTDADAQAYRAALAAEDRGELSQATAQLSALAERYPKSFAVSESLGLAYAQQGEFALAIRWLSNAVRLRPDLAVARNNLGVTFLKHGELKPAIQQFETAAGQYPNDFDSQYDLGQALAQAGDFARSIGPLRRAHELQPQRAEVAYNLALSLANVDRYQEAEQALASAPGAASSAEMQSLWGDVDEKLKRYEAAAQHLQRALELAPSEERVFALGLEFLRHWTLDAAIALLERGTQSYPQSTRIALALDLARFGKGDYAPAMKGFSTLLQRTGNPEVLEFFGRACTTTDPDDPACTDLVEYANQHGNSAAAAAYAAGVLLHRAEQQGNPPATLNEARRLIERALQLDAHSEAAHFAAGVLAAAQHRWPEAVTELQQADRMRPNDSTIEYRLAQAYLHAGKKELAKQELARHDATVKREQTTFDQRYQAIERFLVNIQ